MKIAALLTAGALAAATFAAAAPAETTRVVVRHNQTVVRHGPGWNHHRVRRVCKVIVRNHQRIRRCRTVRW